MKHVSHFILNQIRVGFLSLLSYELIFYMSKQRKESSGHNAGISSSRTAELV